MKKGIFTYIILVCIFSSSAQEKKRDTIVASEFVNITTKYNPKIVTAKKIMENPVIELLQKSDKKKLVYTISSAPVASTFIPKTGVLKGMDLGKKERIYNHYFATGLGNYSNRYAELFISDNTRFDNSFELHSTYNASGDNLKNTVLNSTYSNFDIATFYEQEERYFDWKVGVTAQNNHFNWYGLPRNKTLTENIITTIDPGQNYKSLQLTGDFKFHDSYIQQGNISVAYLTDNFKSSELLVNFENTLRLPLPLFLNTSNEISLESGLEFLKGTFKTNYSNSEKIKYSQFTFKIIPEYKTTYRGLSIKASARAFVSVDSEQNKTNFLVFPDILLKTAIYKEYINGYGGITGNLHTNTYHNFTEYNPYVSPTLFITQTAETSNFFIGFNGSISDVLSYHLKGSLKKEEDKPLFLRNSSKFTEILPTPNEKKLEGYAYGNSFKIYYDDIHTSSILAEIEYIYDANLSFSAQIKFDNYTTTNALESWNLPSIQSTIFTEYKADKWYATANIFHVGERKDIAYSSAESSNRTTVVSVDAFIDLNINGGYHFNDKFSTFLQFNNLLNSKYQRFANFDTQGFQVLGGFTYKFDY
jgi:hypothetical protein